MLPTRQPGREEETEPSIDAISSLFKNLYSKNRFSNSATWLLKREIRQNLEFLADDKVISSGFDTKTYQYHLLQLSYQTPDYKLSNKFNILPLKKRIIMMNQKKSSKSTALKYLLICTNTQFK
jgi:beta-lactamase regulating signal transducer with metallopeptidase domain